jgi:hypothetical protein
MSKTKTPNAPTSADLQREQLIGAEITMQRREKVKRRSAGAREMTSVSDPIERKAMARMNTVLDNEIAELDAKLKRQSAIVDRIEAQLRLPNATKQLTHVETTVKALTATVQTIEELRTALGKELAVYGEACEALYKIVGYGGSSYVERQGHQLFVNQIKSRVRFSLFHGWPLWIKKEFVRMHVPSLRRPFAEMESVILQDVLTAAKEEVRKLESVVNNKEV